MEHRTRKAIWETFPASCGLHQEIDQEIVVAEANERSPEVGRLLESISRCEELLRNFESENLTIATCGMAEIIEISKAHSGSKDLAA